MPKERGFEATIELPEFAVRVTVCPGWVGEIHERPKRSMANITSPEPLREGPAVGHRSFYGDSLDQTKSRAVEELQALYGLDLPPLRWLPYSCLEPADKLQAMKSWAEEIIRSLGGDPESFEWILGDGQLTLHPRQPGAMAHCQIGPKEIVAVLDREDPAAIGDLTEMLKTAIKR